MVMLTSFSTIRPGRRARAWLVAIVLACIAGAQASTNPPRFYDDDPITREPEPGDASAAQPWEIGLLYDLSYNLFVVQRSKPSGTRAQNINTIDEVPDSSWFTNRIGTRDLTPEQIVSGPLTGNPPNPERWTLIREKSAGVSPGFTAIGASGETWFVAFDAKWPEGDSAAVVIASKLFWALGYNQVDSYITTVDPRRVVIDPKATARRPSGARTPYTRDDLAEVLERAQAYSDGTYRVAAGRLLSGKVLGGFRYSGTRPDDPNDIVPHEHRRELRALRVFGAWLNLTDLKSGNTIDTLVTENGRGIVKHYLQDVGSTFGTANGPKEWDIGGEYFYEGQPSRRRLYSFGFLMSPWQTVPYTEYPTIGRFEGDRFDPREWRPQTPTPAYVEMRADDAFWAARRVKAFTDEQIRAAVHAGQLSNPAAEQHLGDVIIKRRDKIAAAYLPAVNPIVNPKLDDAGTLTFENAAVAAQVADRPTEYRASWFRFDNATGATTPLGQSQSAEASIKAPGALPSSANALVQVDVAAESPQFPAWREPVHIVFRRTASGWKLVGLERLPEHVDEAGQSAGSKSTQ
jgi:hypothetical protein